MQKLSFDEALERILAVDSRYHRDAYLFVRDSLDHTRKLILKEDRAEDRQTTTGELLEGGRPQPAKDRHVTGQELLEGIRQQALNDFGPMVITVFEEWGVRGCRDFGEIVFNLVEIGQFAKTEKDSRADFDGYDFDDAFRKPYLPSSKLSVTARVPNPAEA
jgi:uncharacterized repeat protein (TIGR04138 family)